MSKAKKGKFKKRKIIIPVLILAIAGAAVFGVVKKRQDENFVKVVSVAEVNEPWMSDGAQQYYGTLKQGSVVNYKAEEELEIDRILVNKGDVVSKGDVLFTYNTKSLEFNADTLKNQLKAIENNIKIANNELAILKRLQPSENAPSDYVPDDEPDDETADIPDSRPGTIGLEARISADTMPFSGSGSQEDPFIYLGSESTVLTADFLSFLADNRSFALVYVCTENGDVKYGRTIDGSKIDKAAASDWVCSTGITTDAMGGVSVTEETPFAGFVVYPYSVNVFAMGGSDEIPNDDEYQVPDDYQNDTQTQQTDPGNSYTYEISDKDNYMYTRAELNKMIEEKQKEIEKLEFDKKQAEIDVKKAEAKLETGAEVASISGTVTFIATDKRHLSENGYFATITSSSGMSITSSVGEFSRDKVSQGDEVTITDWNNGMVYSGEVVSVSDTPIGSEDSGESAGSSDFGTESMYEFIVKSDDSFELGEDSGVSIQFNKELQNSALEILGAFIREENGKFFVYVENSDGVIEKRFVKTKNGIEYSYAFVTSGLSMDDYIAMAYGNVKEGMPVKRVSYQELQGGILGDLF